MVQAFFFFLPTVRGGRQQRGVPGMTLGTQTWVPRSIQPPLKGPTEVLGEFTHWAKFGPCLYCHGLCHMALLHQHDDGMFHRVRVCQVWLSRAVHPWQQGPDTGVFPWTGLHSLDALIRVLELYTVSLDEKFYLILHPI